MLERNLPQLDESFWMAIIDDNNNKSISSLIPLMSPTFFETPRKTLIKESDGWEFQHIEKNRTPMEFAAERYSWRCIEEMARQRKDQEDKAGYEFALLRAIDDNQFDATKCLIEAKAQLLKFPEDDTCLHRVIRKGNYTKNLLGLRHYHDYSKLFGLLLEHGRHFLTMKDNDGKTPIQLAYNLNKIDYIDLIVTKAPNDEKNEACYEGILLNAVATDNIELAGTMLKANFPKNCSLNDNDHHDRALHRAIRKKNIEMIKLLIEHKYDPTGKNAKNITPLQLACELKYVEGIKALGKYKKVESDEDKASYGELLFNAIKDNQLEVAKALLEIGAPVEYRSEKASATIVEITIQNNHYDILCDLVNKGADISRALAIAGPLRIAQLLEKANSSSNKAKDDLKLRLLLERYQRSPDLLENNFFQWFLDILEKRITAEKFNQLAKIFPDLKDRLAKYIAQMIYKYQDDVGVFLMKQVLTEEKPLYNALSETSGKSKNIETLRTSYPTLAIKDLKEDETLALDFLKKRAAVKTITEEKIVPLKTPLLLTVDEVTLELKLETLSDEAKKETGKNWKHTFAFAGPVAITSLLSQAKKHDNSSLTIFLEQELTKTREKGYLNPLFKAIQDNEIAPDVLKKIISERKDFTQRILNHFDNLEIEDAYDILQDSFTNANNPFHSIWSPNGENTRQFPCSLAWAKFKNIEEQFLKKSRELAVSCYATNFYAESSLAKILPQLRKGNVISLKDYKELKTHPRDLLAFTGQDESLYHSLQYKFMQELIKKIQQYSQEIKTESHSVSEFNRLVDKIKICQECLITVKAGLSIRDIRQRWEEKPTSDYRLFKRTSLLSYQNNGLGTLIKEIVANENQWVISAQPPAYNPELDVATIHENQAAVTSLPYNPYADSLTTHENQAAVSPPPPAYNPYSDLSEEQWKALETRPQPHDAHITTLSLK